MLRAVIFIVMLLSLGVIALLLANCGMILVGKPNYCPNCGKKVNW